MKYYLEITLLNQQIFKCIQVFKDDGVLSAKDQARNHAEAILRGTSYFIEDTVIHIPQILYIRIKPLTSNP